MIWSRIAEWPMRRQLFWLLILAQLLAYASSIAIVASVLSGERRVDTLRVELTDAFTTLLGQLPPEETSANLANVSQLLQRDPRFQLGPASYGSAEPAPQITSLLEEQLPAGWHGRFQAFDLSEQNTRPGPDDEPFAVVADLGEETYLWFYPRTSVISGTVPLLALLLGATLLMVPLTLLALWSGRVLVRPVERLSQGALAFSADVMADPLEVAGPQEVRSAISSFNEMQAELRALIEERAQTLASISHDLRTPLTRLRLRMEHVELGDAAQGTERDLKAMEAMIEDALDFLRSESHRVDKVTVDLRLLCEMVVDDFADQGAAVKFVGSGGGQIECDIQLTVRALTNLVDNAVKYAGAALVAIGENGTEIFVLDSGPGIPVDRLSMITKPFNRLHTVSAGAEEAPGFGLGLSIADVNMKRQGGALLLEDNAPSGLVARLKFS